MTTLPNFESLLGAFMSPDNTVRRQAEGVWEDIKRRAPDEVWLREGVVDLGLIVRSAIFLSSDQRKILRLSKTSG